jgi:hypothetical protein
MGNTSNLVRLPTSKELDAEDRAEEKKRIEHEKSNTEIYKLNPQDINYFKISNDLKHKGLVKNYFVNSFLSFIGDNPFLFYSKYSMIASIIADDPRSIRASKQVLSEDNEDIHPLADSEFKELEQAYEQIILMDYVRSAEFSLSSKTFSFEILMKVYPSLGIKNNNIEKLIMSSGSVESFPMEDHLKHSISNFSNKNIEDNVLTLETDGSPLQFYNSDHELVKSANKYISDNASYLLKKENAWNKPYFV